MHDHLRELGRCSVDHAAQSSQRLGKKYCRVKNPYKCIHVGLTDLGRDIVDNVALC
jgi:hypothetical protein